MIDTFRKLFSLFDAFFSQPCNYALNVFNLSPDLVDLAARIFEARHKVQFPALSEA